MSARHPSFLQLDRTALGERSNDEVREHLSSCDACRAHVESAQRAGMTPAWVREMERTAQVPRRRWLWAGSLASAVAATVIVLLFVRNPGQRPGQELADFTTVKGSASAAIHVKSGTRVELWDGHSKLRPTDALRIEVAPDGHRYVGVFAAQHSGGNTDLIQLYAAPLPADSQTTVLPKAWEVDSQPGPETIIVVMSASPVSPELLHQDAEILLRKGIWVQRFTFQKDLTGIERP